MIVNVPSFESLNNSALILHFSAWSTLVRIHADFKTTFEPEVASDEEWSAYLAASQSDLQSIWTLAQQSNELALKAKLCEVTPFLLLLGTDPRLSTTVRDGDFSDFRTLDAADLPAAVNTFCERPLTQKFIETYNELRSLRNKITHLGYAGKTMRLDDLVRILVFQYLELWSGRQWLKDRVHFASLDRLSFFDDGKWSSHRAAVFAELPHALALLQPSEFKRLLGHPKSARRYLCHACTDERVTREMIGGGAEAGTAFLERHYLHCAMCDERYKIKRAQCAGAHCKGSVIGDNNDEYSGRCHTCGRRQ